MDQIKIGTFIAKMRKEKGLTQRELVDILAISDKTVSKWERGGGMPEISLMQPLCRALEIDLNELFSGRRPSGDDYRRHADENLMALIHEAESARMNIVGAQNMGELKRASMSDARKVNEEFWESAGNELLGPLVLPKWGSFLPDENQMNLLGSVKGRCILEIGCGNGKSMKYLADKGAQEVWGIDISQSQLARARENLTDCHGTHLICTPMEEMHGIPEGYFDAAFSVFGLGWTEDLDTTLSRIHASLKPGGIFVFSWSHPIHKCTAWDNARLIFNNPYFDESPYAAELHGRGYIMKNSMLSTYINALTACGFAIESLIETTDRKAASESTDLFAAKAQIVPTAFAIRAIKTACCHPCQ